ncbi:MAG: hypothetical protein ACMUJM_02880 [bacterium]
MKNMVQFLKRNKLYKCLLITLALIFTLSAGVVYSASVPHTFVAGTTAKASEVNENFSYLAERSWDLSESSLYFNGKVGIGTASPLAKLHILNGDFSMGGETADILLYGSVNNDAYLFLEPENSESGFFDIGAFDTEKYFEDPEAKLRIDAETVALQTRGGGNVGIGTTEPGAKLEILDDSHSAYIKSLKVYSPNIEAGERGIISFGKEDSNYNAAELTFYYDGDASSSNRLSFKLFGSPETLHILGTGNVGIGTENPSEKLEVNGNIKVAWGVDTPYLIMGYTDPEFQYDYIRLRTRNTVINENAPPEEDQYMFGGFMFDWPNSSGNPFIDGAFNIFTYHEKNIALVSPATIITGSVGIGTDDPQGTLDVNGAIYQRGSELHADYVFEPNYRLESITEHAEFMWKNKHLKAIPKANIDETGQEIIEVGAHRKGIVEELEKAHIYIEQLHKEISAMEERNSQMEERVAKLEAILNNQQ